MPIYSQEHKTKPKSSSTVRVAIAVTMMVALLGTGILQYALQTDPRETLALRTKGAILGVTVGTQPLVIGTRGLKLLHRVNPALAERFGATVLRSSTGKPGNLVVWQHYGKAGFWSGPSPALAVETSDELGHTVREITQSADFLEAKGEYVFPFVLSNFPRRGREVRISFSELGQKSVEKTMVVPNPQPGKYPVWQPTTADRVGKTEGLAATLRELRFIAGTADYPLDTAQLTVAINQGGPASDWKAEKLEISEATGNINVATTVNNALQTAWDSGNLQLNATQFPESNENAFRVKLTLARIGKLPVDETNLLPKLPIPPKHVCLTEKRSAQIHSSTIEVTHEIGEGAPHDLGWGSGGLEFGLWVREPPPDRVLRVRYSGDRYWETPGIQGKTAGCYCIDMPDASPGDRVDLHVALTRSRTLEFFVRPTKSGSSPQSRLAPGEKTVADRRWGS